MNKSTARIALLAGSLGSVALVLIQGRSNNSPLLLLLFALWVCSPFFAMLMGRVAARRWPVRIQTAIPSVI